MKISIPGLLFLAAVSILSPLASFARTITVTPGTDKIQAAIDGAAVNDVIFLAAGVHVLTRSVNVNKKVTIDGAGSNSAFVQKHNAANADVAGFVVNVDGATLKNFELRGRNVGGPGILVYANSVGLSNLYVHNCGNDGVKSGGVILHTANLCTLNNVRSNANRMVGISQYASSDNAITNCTANSNGAEGLTIDLGSHNCRVSGCTFNGNNTRNGGVGGIGIDQVNGAWVKNSTISGTQSGKSGITFQNNVGGEDGCVITGNTITNNAGHGILVRNCTHAVTNTTLTPNTFSGNRASPNIRWECGAARPQAAKEEIVLEKPSPAEAKIYPNPAASEVQLTLTAEKEGPASIQVYSASGQTVLQKQVSLVKGFNQLRLDVSGLPNGIYTVQLISSGQGQSFRLEVKK